MFDHGENGYGEYRATQGGSDKNAPGPLMSLIITLIGLGIAIPFIWFLLGFIYYS